MVEAKDTVKSNKEIAGLCAKHLAWDEPVSERDIELAKPLFQAQAEVSFKAGMEEESTQAYHVGLADGVLRGRREVVETARRRYYNENLGWSTGVFAYLEELQAELKEWGL